MEKGLNDQLNMEFQAAYLYLGMAAYVETLNLPGFAHWMQEQAKEEVGHAMRFYSFITDRGMSVTLKGIEAAPTTYSSLTEVFESALENEKAVTQSIHDLYRLADTEGDFGAHPLLEEFAVEQLEEEKSVTYVLDALRRIGEDGTGLFLLDRDLSQRQPEA
jgi:ferritin